MKIEEIRALDKENQLTMKMRHEYERKSVNKIKSKVWQSFSLVFDKRTDKLIKNYVRCHKCSNFCAYNGETTSKLLKHKCKDHGQPTINDFISNSSKISAHFSKNEITAIRDAAVEFIVKDIRPFYAVEGDGLQSLIKTIAKISRNHPNLSDTDIERLIPSRKVVRSRVDDKGIEAHEMIKTDLARAIETTGGFCCMIDLYSDRYKCNSYLGIVAKLNIIEENEIHQREYVLNLDTVKCDKKTGEEIRRELIRVLAKFDLTEKHMIENITWITDRGGNIRVALEDCERLNCFAHLINNLVEHMCKKIEPVNTLITNAASLVRYLKKSGLSIQDFKTALQSYCETRWNTVYYLLSSIVKNYNSILDVLARKEIITPTSNAIAKLTRLSKPDLTTIADFLETFTLISVNVQGSKFATLHTVWPFFNKIEKHLAPNPVDSANVKLMKAKGLEYISKNLNAFRPKMIHKVAVFLHPAAKQLNCASEQDREQIIEHVRRMLPNNEIERVVSEVSNRNLSESNRSRSLNASTSFFEEFINRTNESSDDLPLQLEPNDTSNEINNYIGLEVSIVSR